MWYSHFFFFFTFPKIDMNHGFIQTIRHYVCICMCCYWKWIRIRKPTFCFKSKVAKLADIWPDICVCANMFLQHARLFAAYPALLTDVLSPASATHINIVFIGFVPEIKTRQGLLKLLEGIKYIGECC